MCEFCWEEIVYTKELSAISGPNLGVGVSMSVRFAFDLFFWVLDSESGIFLLSGTLWRIGLEVGDIGDLWPEIEISAQILYFGLIISTRNLSSTQPFAYDHEGVTISVKRLENNSLSNFICF